MALAHSLQQFLETHGSSFDTVAHPYSASAERTAAAAHVSGERLAKSVVVEDDNAYFVVVIPATHRLDLGKLHHRFGHLVGMATEEEIADLFTDCSPGAIPALGAAYGLKTLVDDSLMRYPDIYFEAGDHEHLVHLDTRQFQALAGELEQGSFSHHR